MRSTCKLFAFCLLFTAVTGCDTGGPEPEEMVTKLTKQLRQITSEVPSFAGVNFEGDVDVDQLVVYLFEPDKREAARDTLRAIFGGQAARIALLVRARQGGASVELADKAADMLNVEGVIGVAYGGHGYLSVYVTEAKAVERAQEKLREIEISPDKVVLRVTTMFVAYQAA